MKRITLIAVLGASIGSLSFGQTSQRDTTAVADTAKLLIDTTSVQPQPTTVQVDTLPVKPTDSAAVRSDTTALEIPPVEDSTAARIDTTVQEDSKKTPAQLEVQPPPSRSTSLDPNGYKDVHWGMTFRDVHDYLVDNDNVDEYAIQPITNGFEYPGMVAGIKATVSYQFDNDRLFIVRLAPKVKAISRFDFLDTFEEYQATLEAKYGKPTRSGFHKIDEQYLNTIESIQLGFAKKYALWEFERSYIVLVLAGHNKRLEVHITYVSRAIFDEMKDRIETLKLEDF